MNIEIIKKFKSAQVDCGNGYFREYNSDAFVNSTEFALAVIACAKNAPMGDYWSEKEACNKLIEMSWQDRITTFGLTNAFY